MVKRVRKKQRKRVRSIDWQERGDTAFSHDRVRHLRTSVMPDEEEVPEIPEGVAPNACVVSASGPWGFVELDGTEELCRVDERLMVGPSSVLAPGDEVLVEWQDDQAFIRALAARRTKLSRPAVKISRVKEQVVAANADLLIIVASARKPAFKAGLIDRYLVAAEVGGVEPIVCINKMDLVTEPLPESGVFRTLGFEVFEISCETGVGVDSLRDRLRGKLSVLAGQSGVGKSSLLNVLDPDLRIATQEVSDYNEKGKHTTTQSRMYFLEDGIRVIDTPGIRRLGVWGVTPEELAFYFPELVERASGCKFRDCTHIHEPDCAVRAAVDDGEIPKRRYGSYLRLREDLERESRSY